MHIGSLPWQSMKSQDHSKADLIKQKKCAITIDELCKGMPTEFKDYFNYVDNLKFGETPDYAFLKDLFRSVYIRNAYGKVNTMVFEKVVNEQKFLTHAEKKDQESIARAGTLTGFETGRRMCKKADIPESQFFFDIAQYASDHKNKNVREKIFEYRKFNQDSLSMNEISDEGSMHLPTSTNIF